MPFDVYCGNLPRLPPARAFAADLRKQMDWRIRSFLLGCDVSVFHLIRHGERKVGEDILVGRMPGIDLSQTGIRQAERLANAFGTVQFTTILSSPLERAQTTAAPLAHARRLPVQTSVGIHEIDFGVWTNRPWRELESDSAWQQFNRARSLARAPGGESLREVQHRFVSEMLRLHERDPGGVFALVSHADPIRTALMYFAGLPLEAMDRFALDYASVTTIEVTPWGSRIIRVNTTFPEV